MKKLLLISSLCGCTLASHAQNQIELYQQQIAANQVLIGYIQKGITTAQTGLTSIGELKNGEFNLHDTYFNSLWVVNPTLKKMAKVTGLIVSQVRLLKKVQTNLTRVNSRDLFTVHEIHHIESMLSKLLQSVMQQVNALLLLLSDNELQLSDDERVQRINVLYEDYQNSSAFFQHFAHEITLLAKNRQREIHELKYLKKIVE